MTTDIEDQGILKLLPVGIRPYAVLMRLDRPIGWWLLLLPAWWAIILSRTPFDGESWHMMVLFLVGAIVMRGAGCVINDIWDRNLDMKVERTKTRPIASGVISLRQAICFTMILSIIGLWVLVQLPPYAIMLGLVSIPFIVVYPLMKRFTWWPQLFLGLTFNFGALIGWAAMTGALDWPALSLYAAGIFWTLGYDTIYASMDKKDDAQQGIQSTARRFGDAVKIWVYGFYIMAFALLVLTVLLTEAFWPVVTLMAVPLMIALRWIRDWDPDNDSESLRLFKRQRDIGLFVCLILLLCCV